MDVLSKLAREAIIGAVRALVGEYPDSCSGIFVPHEWLERYEATVVALERQLLCQHLPEHGFTPSAGEVVDDRDDGGDGGGGGHGGYGDGDGHGGGGWE